VTGVTKPVFGELTPAECVALLSRNHVGRIAYSHHDRVDIEPTHYVYADGWIHGRTSLGSKLRTLAHNRWVAFEVDETEGLFDWQSVVVKGALYLLESDGPQSETYVKAVETLRSLSPHALGEDDPAPERTFVFRIHADVVTGRSATTKS
jgi:nitroimidazol reductase NimA-like FMN-containing flavoprotein (pyridoxamine 5'-phosphate oxidase superfamily)